MAFVLLAQTIRLQLLEKNNDMEGNITLIAYVP